MMRRNAYLLIGLAAAVLAASGCSPFHAKTLRQTMRDGASDTVPPTAARPASGAAGSLSGLLAFQSRRPEADRDEQSRLQQIIAIARLSERRGQPEQAERLYRQIMERAPTSAVPHHRLGVMRAKKRLFAEAEKFFAKAYELDPSNAELLNDIGYYYYLSSQPERAEQFYRHALAKDPTHKATCNNLAILLGEQGRLDEARSFFRRTGTDAQVEANMAFLHAQRGDVSRAVAGYDRALTLDQGLLPAAHALLKLAKFEPAERRSRRPADPPAAAAPTTPAVIEFARTRPQQHSAAAVAEKEPPTTVTIVETPPAAIVETPPAPTRPRSTVLPVNRHYDVPLAATVTDGRLPTASSASVVAAAKPARSAAAEPARSVAAEPAPIASPLDKPPASSLPPAKLPAAVTASVTDRQNTARGNTPTSSLLGTLLQKSSLPEKSNGRNDPPIPESRGFRPNASLKITDEQPAGLIKSAAYEPAEGSPKTDRLQPCAAEIDGTHPDAQPAQQTDRNPLPQVLEAPPAGQASSGQADAENGAFLNAWLNLDTSERPSSRRAANPSSRRKW
jgi:Flp pilus assembly protein TadD